MKNVEFILNQKGRNRGVLGVAPDATVLDALRVMAEHNVGALLVMDGWRLVGLFSERDYARKVILQGKASRSTLVREIMSSDLTCVTPDHSIEECMELMTDNRIRHLPVLIEDRAVGVISIGDVVKEMMAEQRFMIEQLEHYITS